MRLLLQRHLAGQFILPMGVSLVFFVCFLLTFELFRLTSLLMSRDTSLFFLGSLMGNLALTFIPLALPLSTYFAVLFCLNKLSTDSEYIAMRAAGLNKRSVLEPFLTVSIFMAVSLYFLSQEVIPYTNRDFKRQVNFLTSSGLLASIKSGQFFTAIDGITLFPAVVSEGGRNLKDVFLYLKEDDGEKVILANRGELIYERDSKTLVEKLTLNLFDGGITTTKVKNQNIEKILFETYNLPISQNKYSDRINPRETMLNRRELSQVIKMPLEEAKAKYRFNQKDMLNAIYEYWNRINTPILCLLLTFVGFGLGIKENRGRNQHSALKALGSLILFYVLFFGLVSVARKGNMPMWAAMAVPDVVLLGLGIHFYRKLDWVG